MKRYNIILFSPHFFGPPISGGPYNVFFLVNDFLFENGVLQFTDGDMLSHWYSGDFHITEIKEAKP
jgi:hypothetical protein